MCFTVYYNEVVFDNKDLIKTVLMLLKLFKFISDKIIQVEWTVIAFYFI